MQHLDSRNRVIRPLHDKTDMTTSNSNPANRMSMIDQWIGRRMDEVQQATATIDQRMELLRSAEGRVLQLIDTLRVEVRTAEPITRQLDGMTRDAENQVAKAISAAESQLPKLTQAVSTQIANCKETFKTAEESIKPLANQAQQIVESAKSQVANLMNVALESVVTQATKRIEVQLGLSVLRAQEDLQGRIAEAKQQLQREVEAVATKSANDLAARLAEQDAQHEVKQAALIEKAKATLAAQVDLMAQATSAAETASRGYGDKLAAMQSEVLASMEQHRQQIETTKAQLLEQAKSTLTSHIEQMRQVQQETQSNTEECTQRLKDLQTRAMTAIEEHQQDIERMHADLLDRSKESMAEHIEKMRGVTLETKLTGEEMGKKLLELQLQATATMDEHFQETQKKQVELMERVRESMAGHVEQMRQVTHETEVHAEGYGEKLVTQQSQVIAAMDLHRQQIEQVQSDLLESTRSKIAEHVVQMRQTSQSAETAGKNYSEKLVTLQAEIVASMEQYRQQIEKLASRRFDDLDRTSVAYVEQLEQRLLDRVRAAKAGVQGQMETITRELRTQVKGIGEMAAVALNHEIARLQGDADSRFGWIEQRLQQRLDRLMDQSRNQGESHLLRMEASVRPAWMNRSADEAVNDRLELTLHLPTGPKFVEAHDVDVRGEAAELTSDNEIAENQATDASHLVSRPN